MSTIGTNLKKLLQEEDDLDCKLVLLKYLSDSDNDGLKSEIIRKGLPNLQGETIAVYYSDNFFGIISAKFNNGRTK